MPDYGVSRASQKGVAIIRMRARILTRISLSRNFDMLSRKLLKISWYTIEVFSKCTFLHYGLACLRVVQVWAYRKWFICSLAIKELLGLLCLGQFNDLLWSRPWILIFIDSVLLPWIERHNLYLNLGKECGILWHSGYKSLCWYWKLHLLGPFVMVRSKR